jgi:hypothetical protein
LTKLIIRIESAFSISERHRSGGPFLLDFPTSLPEGREKPDVYRGVNTDNDPDDQEVESLWGRVPDG